MIGFKFNNVHSSEMGVYAINLNRSALPALRRKDYIISGRDGTIDYGGNTYETRIISLEIASIDNETLEEFRKDIRKIAKWISGEGYLIFDDEPDKAYKTKVYDAVAIDPVYEEDYVMDTFNAGLMQVSFECQPFAETPNYNQVLQGTNQNEERLEAAVNGTQPTCCIIKITNIGKTDIKGINILRKAKL